MEKNNYDKTQLFNKNLLQKHKPTTARLLVIGGPLSGASFSLEKESVSIGRLSDNDITITSSGISKNHCQIIHEKGDRFFIIDPGSTNGTIINGRALKQGLRMQLIHGDTISVADTSFFFLHPEQSEIKESSEELDIDFSAAAIEADEILKGCSEILVLSKARRGKR